MYGDFVAYGRILSSGRGHPDDCLDFIVNGPLWIGIEAPVITRICSNIHVQICVVKIKYRVRYMTVWFRVRCPCMAIMHYVQYVLTCPNIMLWQKFENVLRIRILA